MNALELPSEILNRILVFAIFTRRLKRALRLRLVCKTFSITVVAALFETRLLDESQPGTFSSIYSPWQIRNHNYAYQLHHSYLVYRVTNEQKGIGNRLLEIREIATLIHEHSTQDLATIVDRLCWLGFKYAFPILRHGDYWGKRGFVKKDDGTREQNVELAKPNRGLSLLAAAAYFDLAPLTLQLLSEGCSPDQHNYMFPTAFQAAAWAGNSDMVQILQRHVANQPTFAELSLTSKWLKLTGTHVIIGAAIRGDLAFLMWVMNPVALGSPSDKTLAGVQIGQIARESNLGNAIYATQRSTRSPEIHKYLQGFLDESLTELDPQFLFRDFVSHCEWGNTSMVEYFLDNGVSVNTLGCYARSTVLCIAAQRCQEEVVDLLLKSGADPNFDAEKYAQYTPLPLAASSGSLGMVRKLLDHGAYPNEKVNAIIRLPALWYAVATENTDMINLLESRGASFDVPLEGRPWIGENAMEMAEELYLDSMFDLLRVRGIEIVDRWNNTGCAPWQKWGIANNPPRNNPLWAKFESGDC